MAGSGQVECLCFTGYRAVIHRSAVAGGDAGMQFRILGRSVEVRSDDGTPIPLRPQAQRLVATLILVGRQVSADELKDLVWEGSEQGSASSRLASALSRLRSVLGTRLESIQETEGTSYRLNINPDADWVDLRVFETLLEMAEGARRDGDPEVESGLYRHAFSAVWPDPHLPGLPSTVAMGAERERLHRLWFNAYIKWVEVRLDLGEHQALTEELPRVFAADPFNEQLAANMMVAMFRSGLKPDALAWYDKFAKRLREDRNTEPGPGLLEVYEQVDRNADALIYRSLPPRVEDQKVLASGADPRRASHPRMFRVQLGKKGGHLPVDRLAVKIAQAGAEHIDDLAWVNEAFIARAIRWVALNTRTSQWLELVMGEPTEDSPHILAPRARKGRHRVLYVVSDRNTVARVGHQYAGESTGMVFADLEAPSLDEIMHTPERERLIRTDEPVAIIMRDSPSYMPDAAEPTRFLQRLLAQFPPGSHLIFSAATNEVSDRVRQQLVATFEQVEQNLVLRSPEEITRMLTIPGVEWLDPGIVPVGEWRSDRRQRPLQLNAMGGVGCTAASTP